jgi:hypothetical protein
MNREHLLKYHKEQFINPMQLIADYNETNLKVRVKIAIMIALYKLRNIAKEETEQEKARKKGSRQRKHGSKQMKKRKAGKRGTAETANKIPN